MKNSLKLLPKESRLFKRAHNFGFNTCHAPLVMRSDLQAQMSRAHSELGMRYFRCHGTLSDDVGLVSRTSSGRLELAFSGLKRILDAGLSCGVKPFLELSFMPGVLARDPEETITHYRGLTSPPQHWAEWREVVERTVRFLVETYGISEVREWYFEVWNEPNIPFWSGTKEEYFRLYREAARAVKAVDAQLRVGGPATARAEWIGDLLRDCKETRTPIDFVSAHAYPSDAAFSHSAVGEVQLLGSDFLRDLLRKARMEIDAQGFQIPLFWGEWNSSAGPLAENHDEANNAALVCSVLAGIEDFCEGSLFWNLSDIYEECGYHFTPFHGGYGLYTVDGIAKSAARAFELWEGLHGERISVGGLPDTAARGAFATRTPEGGEISVILWNHAESGQENGDWEVTLSLDGGAIVRAEAVLIVPHAGSAYETWQALGHPVNLSPSARCQLEEASQPIRCLVEVACDGTLSYSLPAGTAARLNLNLKS